MRDSTEKWDAYVRAGDGVAWKSAMTLFDELKPLFLYAVTKNPTLALTYPGLAALFNATSVGVRKAKGTKKKNAKTKAAEAAAAATASLAAASAKAATPTDATPATPAKAGITVNA